MLKRNREIAETTFQWAYYNKSLNSKYTRPREEHLALVFQLHNSCMTYRNGHQKAVSDDGHQTAAALAAHVMNAHLASQVQQNAFML